MEAVAHLALTPAIPTSPVSVCCSFPRGCGGLLEWRNGFTLFVNLPEAGGRGSGGRDSGGRAYPNEFFWLPPVGAAAAAATAAEEQAAGTAGLQAPAGSTGGQQPVSAEVGGAGMWRQGWRLCMSWWPGRGQTEEHPVIQRLIAAGSSSSSSSGGVCSGGSMAAGAVEAAEADALAAGAEQQQQQQAVLLFCRAGGGAYTFCGRLRLATAAASGSSSSTSADSSTNGSGDESRPGLAADGSLCWELIDAPAMLSGQAGGGAIAPLLFT